MTDFSLSQCVHNLCTARAPMICAALGMVLATPVQALPAGGAIVELLEAICIPMAEGDEGDTSVLTRRNDRGGAKGDLLMSWTDRNCRVIAPIDGASTREQERLVKAITEWAMRPVPDAELRGTWDGEKPMFSATNIENALGYLGFIAYPGPNENIYFEFVWPPGGDDEDEDG